MSRSITRNLSILAVSAVALFAAAMLLSASVPADAETETVDADLYGSDDGGSFFSHPIGLAVIIALAGTVLAVLSLMSQYGRNRK